MIQKYTDEEIQDLAASYSIGVLSVQEKAKFETMLKEGGPAAVHLDYFKEIVENLSYNTEALKEPEGLEERLFSRIGKEFRIAKDKKNKKIRFFSDTWSVDPFYI